MVEIASNNERPGGIKNEIEDFMGVFEMKKGTLAQKLANAMLEKISLKIDNDMTCSMHRG